MSVELFVDTPAALVQGVTGQADYVGLIHHSDSVGQFLRGGLEPREAILRDSLKPFPPRLGSLGEALLERLLRTT